MRHVLALAPASQGPRLLRPIRPAVTGGAAVLLLAGCGALGGGSSGGANAPGSPTITVAAVPSIGDAPLYLARRDGLFAQHGLTVTIKNYGSLKAEVEALGNGQADIAAGDYTGFFAAAFTTFAAPGKEKNKQQNNPAGTTLRVIGDGYDAANNVMEVLTMPGSLITSAADLQGKPVYTPPAQAVGPSKLAPYNIETLATQTVLRNDQVSVTTINWHPSAPGQEVQALRNHKASAILVGEPYLFQAEKQLGAVSVLDSASGVTAGLPLLGYFTTSAYTSAHAQSIRAFQAAMTAAQTRAAARGQIQSMFTSAVNVSPQDAPLIALGSYPTFFSVGQVQHVADLMFEAGMLNTSLDVRELAIRP